MYTIWKNVNKNNDGNKRTPNKSIKYCEKCWKNSNQEKHMLVSDLKTSLLTLINFLVDIY